MMASKIDEIDVSTSKEYGKCWKRKRNASGKEIIIRIKLEDDQEQEFKDLLKSPQNTYIQDILSRKNCFEWSGSLSCEAFLKWLTYLCLNKKSESSERILNRLTKQIYPGTGNVCSSSYQDSEQFLFENESNGRYQTYQDKPIQKVPVYEDTESYDLNQLCFTHLPSVNQDNEPIHEIEKFYHPNFNTMRDSYIAMINRANSEGVYLVTNIPEADKTDGYYKNGSYVILRRGAKCSEISIWIIYEYDDCLKVSGSERQFSSLFQLIQYHQQKNLPNSESRLIEPLETCHRCERCKIRWGK